MCMAERHDEQTLAGLPTTKPIPANPCDAVLPHSDCSQRQHLHWQHDHKIVPCDSFLEANRENNGHQLFAHQSRPCSKPFSSAFLTRAYGNLMAPKLVKCLEDKEFHVRQKALSWAVELLATSDGRVQCFAAGILPALVKRFSEEDTLMKQQLACAFKHAAGMQDGCIEMSQLGVIQWILKMISSDDEKLRETALDALHEAAFCETVRLELVHGESTIIFIVEKIRGIHCGSCIVFGLKILQRCLAGGTDQTAMTKLLNADAVLTSIDLIKHTNSDVQETAIRFLCILGMDNRGKIQAWQRLGIVELLPLLKENGKSVQTSAAAALMSVTVDINAKKAFIDGKGTSSIIPLLNLQDEMLSLNVLQLVTNIAEHPLGRYELQQGISSVQHTMDTSRSIVQKRFAKAALQQLSFEHRPFS